MEKIKNIKMFKNKSIKIILNPKKYLSKLKIQK
jgi:hypothetical protein